MYSPVHVRYLGAITKDHIRQGSISAPPIHTFKKKSYCIEILLVCKVQEYLSFTASLISCGSKTSHKWTNPHHFSKA